MFACFVAGQYRNLLRCRHGEGAPADEYENVHTVRLVTTISRHQDYRISSEIIAGSKRNRKLKQLKAKSGGIQEITYTTIRYEEHIRVAEGEYHAAVGSLPA